MKDESNDCQFPSLNAISKSLPSVPGDAKLKAIRKKSGQLNRSVVVLDDDPTGTQTVFDVPVLTEWSVESLVAEFKNQTPLFFLLTNSRSMEEVDACELANQIGVALVSAREKTGRNFELISRSDSTLRGHYPAEVDELARTIGQSKLPQLIVPFFLEGNRLTVNDVHYVVQNDLMIPAAETPFARDAVFGYQNSNLKDWIEEKTAGRIKRDDVYSISVESLRSSPEDVKKVLRELPPESVCVVNSLELRDLEVFVDQLLDVCDEGKEFVYRTAASFVQIRAGLEARPMLKRSRMVQETKNGGLIVVGSYVPKTTRQLNQLIQSKPEIASIELSVERLVDPTRRDDSILAAQNEISQEIVSGHNVVLYTSRDYLKDVSPLQELRNGHLISSALVDIVSGINESPKFLVAKGGITSSDLATQALNVQRAMVLGQILPGVPVWRLGKESRYPGMGYVVFPGNVGDDGGLIAAYERLTGQPE